MQHSLDMTTTQVATKRIVIWVSEEEHRRLKVRAAEEGRTMASIVRGLLTEEGPRKRVVAARPAMLEATPESPAEVAAVLNALKRSRVSSENGKGTRPKHHQTCKCDSCKPQKVGS